MDSRCKALDLKGIKDLFDVRRLEARSACVKRILEEDTSLGVSEPRHKIGAGNARAGTCPPVRTYDKNS